ncbi:centrosomal protein of 78 kDa-like [Physella acuta]|uniref:centrosomal protein of 78 kDa-like n=1 Tax=Physella acuta TaxID=109671 RepID=UPI0027DE7D9B|nr:centrosomal protein of 78 kDa-like [Physella acuta]
MRRHLKEERLARAKADQRVIKLMLENRRLEETVAQLQKVQQPYTSPLEDASFLESIETSFKQFHAFIDMLREAGLGQLVSMAGLDQSRMPFNGNSTKQNGHAQEDKPGRPAPTRPMTSSPNAVYANVPMTDGDFRTGFKMADDALFPNAKDPTMQSNMYTEESELAKQEADELYTRLVRETRSALSHDGQTRERTWAKSTNGHKGEVTSKTHHQPPDDQPTRTDQVDSGHLRTDQVDSGHLRLQESDLYDEQPSYLMGSRQNGESSGRISNEDHDEDDEDDDDDDF